VTCTCGASRGLASGHDYDCEEQRAPSPSVKAAGATATPRPWSNGLAGYCITGPTTPAVCGVTVEESLARSKWIETSDEGPEPTFHTPIVVGQRTIAIVVWERGNEAEGHANAALIVEAVNSRNSLLERVERLEKAINSAGEDARAILDHNMACRHDDDLVRRIVTTLTNALKARAALEGGGR
jgi:uncharacterized protein (UPF0335 family)